MKITLINDGIDQELYDKYKTGIYNLVEENYKLLDLKVDLIVKLSKFDSNYNGTCKRKRKKYEVMLSEKLLYEVEETGNPVHLDLVIYHELIHVCDSYEVNSKNTSYKTCLNYYRTYDDFIINIGHNSWTEFHACVEVFHVSNAYKFEYTFLKLVKMFENITKLRDKILDYCSYDQEFYNEMVDNYFSEIHKFVYRSSRFFASIPYVKNYKHCEKTRNKKEYIYVMKLYKKLMKVFSKSFYGMYGKNHIKRLYKIGYIWITELYIPLNIYPVKDKGKAIFVFES